MEREHNSGSAKGNLKEEVKNYRPVSLLPGFSKVMETILPRCIAQHLGKHNILSTNQHGFREGHSAADLHFLRPSKWSAGFEQKSTFTIVAVHVRRGRAWSLAALCHHLKDPRR